MTPEQWKAWRTRLEGAHPNCALDVRAGMLALLDAVDALSAVRELPACDHVPDMTAIPPHCRVCGALWDRRSGRVLFARIAELERERDAALRDLAASEREADRLRHNVPVEGDFVCPDSQLALSLDPDTTDYEGDIAQCEAVLEEVRGA